MRWIIVDAAWICAVMFVAKDGPISVTGKQVRLNLILIENVPLKCKWPSQRSCACDNGVVQADTPHHSQ
jgi:hypothetical protein